MHTAFLSTTDICTGAPSSFTPSIKKWRHKNFLKDNNNYNKTNNKKKQNKKKKKAMKKPYPQPNSHPNQLSYIYHMIKMREKEKNQDVCVFFYF